MKVIAIDLGATSGRVMTITHENHHFSYQENSRFLNRTYTDENGYLHWDFPYLFENIKKGKPITGIGKNCKIANTIIDKNAMIGDNCKIGISGKKYEDGDHGSFYSADGIIVIRKGAIIPPGTEI